MIVPMKKVTIFVQSRETEGALDTLGRIGVLHIEHQKAPEGRDISSLEEELSRIEKAITLLPEKRLRPTGQGAVSVRDTVEETLRISEEKNTLLEDIRKLSSQIEEWREWGDFDPEIIEYLESKKIWVRLCKLNKGELKKIPDSIIVETLFRKGNVYYCALISRDGDSVPVRCLRIPGMSLGEMQEELTGKEKRLAYIERRLEELSSYRKDIFSWRDRVRSELEFNKALYGMGSFREISYLTGYCPADTAAILEEAAEKEEWGLLIEEPREEDKVPTLIKNPRWIDIIRPVFRMINVLPGYREVDISMWFLLFFSVFFGMLIGDAGYGALFFSMNFILHMKLGKRARDRSIFFLMYVLSACSIIWGLLSGTFFGQAVFAGRLKPLFPYLRDNRNVQMLCFFLGASHLSVAHLWRLLRKLPSLSALAEAGWVMMLWAAYFIARALIIGEPFNSYGKFLIIGGGGLIILFSNPGRNIFKCVGSGIGEFLLHVVSSFTDVVSYIRLFAVGAAGVAVADAFNNMALSVGYNNFFAGFLTVLILLFGHTLNILLGAMGILVHGVRLNVLEFSSHLNMEWSGVEYAPFKEKKEPGYESRDSNAV